jgi:trk system potassium uptake protein TrkA
MQPLAILIVGTGKLGRETGKRLMAEGHRLTFIEKDHDTGQDAKAIFGDKVIIGDGCDPKVLEQAGITTMNVIIAATGDDEDNLIIAELAHHIFGVQKVITRVNRPENQWLFTAHRGVDVSFSPVSMSADFIKAELDKNPAK